MNVIHKKEQTSSYWSNGSPLGAMKLLKGACNSLKTQSISFKLVYEPCLNCLKEPIGRSQITLQHSTFILSQPFTQIKISIKKWQGVIY